MNIGNGVYARNLMLCRLVNAPLVYGEALYQDNVKEATELMKKDLEKGGVRTNSRIIRSATSYFNALYSFLRTL
jgi:hypothetical protein